MKHKEQIGLGVAFFEVKGWKPFPFQLKTWKHYLKGYNGIVNAATGSGKTYSLIVPIMIEFLAQHHKKESLPTNNGLQAIWLTPIKALAKEIQAAAQEAASLMGIDWRIEIRTGDTSSSQRAKQRKKPPEILITTPESLHLLLATNKYESIFKNLKVIVADEWHELVGSKRGVQVELALSRLRSMIPKLKVWGISATIGNMEEAAKVLFGKFYSEQQPIIVKSKIKKKIFVKTVLPKNIEMVPWAGHMGMYLLDQVVDIIKGSKTTLVFTNTRNQCERWYHTILERYPYLAGIMAMHHSSIDKEQRIWVEEALHKSKLKLVVCTSSLDLGVDFRPVETVIQIGSPKGIARFLQRAGRSGHQPGATSVVYFVPTHALELIEGAALRRAIEGNNIESRIPFVRSFDVLIQYLVTLSISGGFDQAQIFKEIKQTYCYEYIDETEWEWILSFITTGGQSLEAYDEYNRVGMLNGRYYIVNQKLARRHKMSMGTIVSDTTMDVKYMSGKRIGKIEERFISGLKPGDVFIFSGRTLELVIIRQMEVRVRASKKKTGLTPAWVGGRMSFSSQLSDELRYQMEQIHLGNFKSPELKKMSPLIELQKKRSHVPAGDEFLVEYFKDREGYHLVFYPYDGRFVNEGLSSLLAWRIAQQRSISFTIGMNDYGFELLSDQEICVEEVINKKLFRSEGLWHDIQQSANAIEMAKRKFRDIASISGLIFKGFPGAEKKSKHLQSSAALFFEVFQEYEPDNLLLQQAEEEVMQFQIEEKRLRETLDRIANQIIVISYPGKVTPFAFPIMVDRMREKVSSESIEDRIKKMHIKLIQ
ncbi:MAG: ATP-dependent Lhr-like helicase [Saprospiraceae bacterium]|jgi:ATP-dependent Lhr-like helicase